MAEAALTVAEARVAALEAAGRAQDEKHRLEERAWAKAAERFADEAMGRVAAIAADRESLAGRLRDYEARARRSDLSAITGGAGGNAGALGGGGGVSTPAAVDAALDDFARRARRCDAIEAFWLAYASSVGVPIVGPRVPD